MKQTSLGADGYWGLTLLTAHDETLLLGLKLLTATNKVLNMLRHVIYARYLMARVTPSAAVGRPGRCSALA